MFLFETNANGMTISFLKHVEHFMLSRHLYGPLKIFHMLLIANQNYHKHVSNYCYFSIYFLFCRLNIKIKKCFVYYILPFT